jgi:hypothetical protein
LSVGAASLTVAIVVDEEVVRAVHVLDLGEKRVSRIDSNAALYRGTRIKIVYGVVIPTTPEDGAVEP